MKRILVPLDGTKDTEKALGSILEICSPGDTVVLLSVQKPYFSERTGTVPGNRVRGAFAGPSGGVLGVTTPDVPVYGESEDQAVQGQHAEARDYLEGLAQPLRQAGLDAKTEVITDAHPGDAIVKYAKAMSPTMIAMLRRSHFSLFEFLPGQVTNHVVQAEVAPVLLIPAAS